MNYNIGPRILEAKEGFHRDAKIMQELEREAKKGSLSRKPEQVVLTMHPLQGNAIMSYE